MRKIDQVAIQVSLKDGDTAQTSTFSRIWTLLLKLLKLSSDPLSLVIVSFLIAEADIAEEELLIGLLVLHHLDIDTKTLLEEKRDVLHGSDC